MKRSPIYALVFLCFLLLGVNECEQPAPTFFDQKVEIRRVDCLRIALSRKEMMILHTKAGAFFVRNPSEKLKKLLSDVKEGDVMLLTAEFERNGGADTGVFDIKEIVMLPGGERYRP